MKKSELRQIIKEEISKVLNEEIDIISKNTKKSEFGDEIYDNYVINIQEEPYTTSEGLTFQLKCVGYVSIPEGEELDLNKPFQFYYFIQTIISDENGKELEKIPGVSLYGTEYIPSRSITKAKKWLDKKGFQLMSGKGYQHKST
jgi:hypothetical protein